MSTTIGRRLLRALALVGASALVSCHSGPPEQILIAGGATMENYLGPVVAAFAKKNPKANIVSEPGGSAAGLVALKRGAIDVATLTQDIAQDEDDLYLRDYLVAKDSLGVVVHPGNPIAELTVAQIASIYGGKVTNWKEVGGKEGKISVLDRPKNSHLRKSFADLVMRGDDIAGDLKVVEHAAKLQESIEGDPHALAYVSLKHVTPGVKVLSMNGVPMTRATILSGRYPLTRSFYLAVHLEPSPLAERFIEFALSKEGQALFAEDGLIPVR